MLGCKPVSELVYSSGHVHRVPSGRIPLQVIVTSMYEGERPKPLPRLKSVYVIVHVRVL